MPSPDARPCTPAADVPLAPLTTLGVGGAARWFQRVASGAEVAAAHAWAEEHHTSLLVMGGGSNLVVADAGFDGLVLQVATTGTTWNRSGDETVVQAAAGERWDALVREATRRGLAGVECLSGIPGCVGGTPVQNVGAYGQDVAAVIESVGVYDRATHTQTTLGAADCQFAYRTSRFRHGEPDRFIVCDVTFRLREGAPTVAYPDVLAELERRNGAAEATVHDVRDAVLRVRGRKGMVLDPADPDTRSVGSFFVNPVVPTAVVEALARRAAGRVPMFPQPGGTVKVPAAWLIEHAGFSKGFAQGPAGLSTKHPLAIVNRGGAAARDVLALAARIARQVHDRTGIHLRPEPVLVGFGDDPDAAYLQRTDD